MRSPAPLPWSCTSCKRSFKIKAHGFVSKYCKRNAATIVNKQEHRRHNYDVDSFEVPYRLVKRVGPIVFKENFSLVSSISIFGCLTYCVVDA